MTYVMVTDEGNWLHDDRHPSLRWRRTGMLEWDWEGPWLLHPNSIPFGKVPRPAWN